MHLITLVAFVTLVAFPRGLLRFPTWSVLGPPRRAMRAMKAIVDQNPSQIKPNPTKIEANPNQIQAKIQNQSQNQIEIQIKSKAKAKANKIEILENYEKSKPRKSDFAVPRTPHGGATELQTPAPELRPPRNQGAQRAPRWPQEPTVPIYWLLRI